MMRKICLLLLALLLVLPAAAAMAQATEAEIPASAMEITVGSDSTDYASRHTRYAKQVMGLASVYTSRNGYASLNAVDRKIYDVLAAAAKEIAAGTRTYTNISITLGDLGWTPDTRWYSEDLGFDIDELIDAENP